MNLFRSFFGLPPSIRIAIYYLAFASVWIIVSDQTLGEFQTLKGLAFVIASALGMGYFIHRSWQARERSEQRFKAVVERAGDVITIIDRNGTQIYHSPAVRQVFGYRPEELIGTSIFEVVHGEDRTEARQILESVVVEPGKVGEIDLRVVNADGSIRYVRSIVTNLLDDPSVKGIVLNTRDITDQKLSEQQIASQLARFQALHEIDLAILENRDIQETLDVVLEHVTGKLDVDAADVLILDTVSQTLEFAHGTGFRSGAIRQSRVALGTGSADRLLLSKRPRIIPNLDEVNDIEFQTPGLVSDGFVGYAAIPLIVRSEVKGVLELFKRSPLEATAEWQVFAEAIGAQTAIAIESANIIENLERANAELRAVYDRTLEGWAAALELRDDETEGHSRRVVDLTLQLAMSLGTNEAELVHIRRGALLHDIGKIGVPDSILLKPGPLDDREWEIMKRHPVYAYDLLKAIPYLHPALDIPHYHHERWDGSGYPHGLRDGEIPLHARIFMVVDVYDALTSDRPYRQAWSDKDALQYIRDEARKLFDPDICTAFLQLMDRRSEGATADQMHAERTTGTSATCRSQA